MSASAYVLLEDGTRFDGDACGADGARDRRGRLHDRHVRLPGVDDRPVVRRPAHHLHLPAHRQLRRRRGGDGVRPRVGARGDHARGRQPRGRARRRAGLAGLAGERGRPGDHRRRHARARAPHPQRGRDARRRVPGADRRGRGARADRRRAVDGRPGPRARGHPAERCTVHGDGDVRIARDRHGDQGLDRPQPRRPRRAGRAAPVHGDRARSCWRASPTRSSWPTAPATPRALEYVVDTVRDARRHAARVGDLPRPPAAVPRRRPGDLQAALRPPRRQPPGQGPRDRADRDHLAEPRLRGRRARRRAPRRRRRARALGDRLRRRRAHPRQPLRPHGRGARAARRAGRRRSSTTPRRGRARTTRCTCSTASCDQIRRADA